MKMLLNLLVLFGLLSIITVLGWLLCRPTDVVSVAPLMVPLIVALMLGHELNSEGDLWSEALLYISFMAAAGTGMVKRKMDFLNALVPHSAPPELVGLAVLLLLVSLISAAWLLSRRLSSRPPRTALEIAIEERRALLEG